MDTNRRQFFRIEDDVLMRYRVVDAHPARGSMDDLLNLEPQLRAIAHRQQELLGLIRDQNDLVAEYLSLLDDKIALVGRMVVARTQDLKPEDRQRVNLSAGGLAFFADHELPVDTVLDIRMVLLPGYESIHAMGRVRACDGVAGGMHFRIAVKFHRIDEQSREMIVRHVMGRDAVHLRERRLASTRGVAEF